MLTASEPMRVEEIVARWDSPFCDGWDGWKPDPAWPLPSLPADAS